MRYDRVRGSKQCKTLFIKNQRKVGAIRRDQGPTQRFWSLQLTGNGANLWYSASSKRTASSWKRTVRAVCSMWSKFIPDRFTCYCLMSR